MLMYHSWFHLVRSLFLLVKQLFVISIIQLHIKMYFNFSKFCFIYFKQQRGALLTLSTQAERNHRVYKVKIVYLQIKNCLEQQIILFSYQKVVHFKGKWLSKLNYVLYLCLTYFKGKNVAQF